MSRRHVAWSRVLWTARIATAVSLVIDAYVHLDLAPVYAEGGGAVNEGVLFRAEAAAASALAAMLVSRYIDLGQIGPFPDLYDPAWYPGKLLAAYAEGAAAVTALAGVVMTGLAGKPRPGAALRQRLTGNRTEQTGGISP